MKAVRVLHWARTNLSMVIAAVAMVVGALLSGVLIVSITEREDALREAETALAELAQMAPGMKAQPVSAIGSGDPSGGDLRINREISAQALRSARTAVRKWRTEETEAILAETRSLAALGAREIERALRGLPVGRRAAAALVSRGDRLTSTAAAARTRADREADRRDAETIGVVLLIMGAAGLALVAVMFSVTASRRRRAEVEAEREAVRRSEQRLQTLVRHGSDMITVVGPDTTVLYEAGAVREMLGYEPSELEGRKLADWLHPEDISELITLCASADGGSPGRELRFRHRDGGLRTCEVRATSLLGEEAWDGIVLNIWDVSERKWLEERLRHQAFHDGLTGLANRALFGDRLEHALARSNRTSHPVCVLLIDLDDFKSINDSFGHAAGDLLLNEVGERISGAMRGADTVARLGGDEFAVVIDDSESVRDDEQTARRILTAIEKPFELRGRSFPINASIGVARALSPAIGAEQLVRNADLAMYSAKATAKGGWAVYEPDMHVAAEERLQLKADLAHAIEACDQLELHYQPVLALDSGAIVGVEALLRWNHPTRGTISPEEFVPLAEESGAIVSLGRWVLREACGQGRHWADGTGRHLVVSVNVSARQLSSDDFCADVKRALADSGFAAERLVLEITETQLMRNMDQVIAVLGEIKRLGVRVAIDDFGTGYSSLGQLEQLPVDILKVDRQLTGGSRDREEHRRLLRAVVEIGDSLNLHTVAEGIETADQLEELRSLGYPLGQGFYFARPMPGTEVGVLIRGRGERLPDVAEPEPERERVAALD